jgi:hypothetical protein
MSASSLFRSPLLLSLPLLVGGCVADGHFYGGAESGGGFRQEAEGSATIYVHTPVGGAPESAGASRRGPDPRAVAEVAATAARQVRRCYRQPRIRHEGRRIVTRLLVRFAPDGSLTELPSVLEQHGVTASSRAHAAAMAEAASLAVIRCAPVRLPPELHKGGWDVLQLTFSPQARA